MPGHPPKEMCLTIKKEAAVWQVQALNLCRRVYIKLKAAMFTLVTQVSNANQFVSTGVIFGCFTTNVHFSKRVPVPKQMGEPEQVPHW